MHKLLLLLLCSLPLTIVCTAAVTLHPAAADLFELTPAWWLALLCSAALVNWSLRRTGPRPWHELG